MEMATETDDHPGLVATDNPEWGDGYREHVESLVSRLEDAAVEMGAAMLPIVGGGLIVSFYGGKGFSLTFDGSGMPHVQRDVIGEVVPARGLFVRCEMWALDALLDPEANVEEDDPETFFIMAGWEMEGDPAVLQRLGRVTDAAPGQAPGQSATNARIGAMMGRFDGDL
jgi:hypothetical protein